MDNTELITKDATEKELLRELVSLQKKNSVRSKVTMIAAVVFVIAFIIVSAIAVPKIVRTFNEANTILTAAEETVSNIDTLVDSANTIINDNSKSVAEALDFVGSIDIDSLNDSISSLSDILKPLAALFGS